MQSIIDNKASDITYKNMQDDEIINMINKGDSLALDYLIGKYKNLVKSKARSYFLIGGDREDVIQEGMIGLYKAIKSYNIEKFVSFIYFADTCVTRQIITAIKSATRKKHMPLNSYISLNKPVYENCSERMLIDTIASIECEDPEELMINRECLDIIEIRLGNVLSILEKDVLMLYMDGMTYEEISTKLGRHSKSIDNAIQRVKRKLEIFIIEDQILSLDKNL